MNASEQLHEHPVEPHERLTFHSHDPAEILAARDEPAVVLDALLARARPSWMTDAACRDVETRVFFTSNPTRALQVCGRCPVMFECREFAITSDTITEGVFGGLDAASLRQARRVRAAAVGVHSYSQRCRCESCRNHRAETVRSWRRRTGRTGTQ